MADPGGLGGWDGASRGSGRLPTSASRPRDGAPIALETEDLRPPSARPLLATRARLHERFGREFIWLYKAKITDGAAVVGRWATDRGPLRLTIYESPRAPLILSVGRRSVDSSA